MTKDAVFNKRLAFPMPFASDSEATKITIPGTVEENNSINFKYGFPSVYSLPKSGGGKYVSRGEMNAIGNLASQNQFYFMAGGLNTFDRDFCDAIGGYPKDAVLEYIDGLKKFSVISLIDDNTYDFSILGVDNVHWSLLNQDNAQEESIEAYTDINLGEVSYGPSIVDETVLVLGNFHSNRDGILFPISGTSVVAGASGQYSSPNNNDKRYPWGVTYFIYDITDVEDFSAIQFPTWDEASGNWNLEGFTLLNAYQSKRGFIRINSFNEDTYTSVSYAPGAALMGIQKNHRYLVCVNVGVFSIPASTVGNHCVVTQCALTGVVKFRLS